MSASPTTARFTAYRLGTDATVKDRLRAYRDVGIDALRVGLRGANIDEELEQLGRLMDLVREVRSETAAS